MADIFKCKDKMPSPDMSDNVASAMTPAEVREMTMRASAPDKSKGVKSVERPRYGHGY